MGQIIAKSLFFLLIVVVVLPATSVARVVDQLIVVIDD